LSRKSYGDLRNALNTLIDALATETKGRGPYGVTQAPLIKRQSAGGSGAPNARKRWLLDPADAPLIWNAILLQGIFGTSKAAVMLIREVEQRQAYADWARTLFVDRQSVAGLGLLRQELVILLDQLVTADLRVDKLPNPFADALPQMGFGPHQGNLLKTLASQTAALSLGDSMMTYYLDGDLEQAHRAANEIATDNPLLLKYRALITRQYSEARDFDELLDFFR
jgi:hypothetical protein